MTYSESIEFLYGLRLFGLKLGLENTLRLAALAGDPHLKLRFIHVAGTNGKGSTCAMLESIYRAAGLRVGLFTSPHLVSFRERIQVDRQLISKADVVRLVGEMQSLMVHFAPDHRAGLQPVGTEGLPARSSWPAGTNAGSTRAHDACAAHPTFFEVITVMALRYFAEQYCDLVIWETGLGGRLDATNIVTPLASVITNVEFDHQQWLGNTRADIAAEKAGIIKPGVAVITATDAPEALEVVARAGREKDAPLTIVTHHEPPPLPALSPASGGGEGGRRQGEGDSDKFMVPMHGRKAEEALNEPAPDGSGEGNWGRRVPAESLLAFGGTGAGFLDNLTIPLLGEHQRLNAALAVATVRAIRDHIPVRDDTVRLGLETVQWPGRMQLVRAASGQRILLDGAHNASSAEALREALGDETVRQWFSTPSNGSKGESWRLDSGGTLILGVLADKDWQSMCNVLAPLARRILLTPVSSERTAAPETLREACRKANPNADTLACPSLEDALNRTANDPFVLITGSLYLVGEAMELLKLSAATVGSERGLNEWTQSKTPKSKHQAPEKIQ